MTQQTRFIFATITYLQEHQNSEINRRFCSRKQSLIVTSDDSLALLVNEESKA